MTIEELRAELRALREEEEKDNERSDWEPQHIYADALLIQYINDPEVTELFEGLGKWYA